MSKSILITGGAASGKSRWAATSYSHYDYVLYMRTGEAVDPDTLHRIEYSNNQNGVDWDIVEGVYDDPAGRIGDHKFVIFDRLSDYASIMIDRMCPDISQMSDELMKSIERRIIAYRGYARAYPRTQRQHDRNYPRDRILGRAHRPQADSFP